VLEPAIALARLLYAQGEWAVDASFGASHIWRGSA